MSVYYPSTPVSLLDGSSDPEGDALSVYRIDGAIVTAWPHSIPVGTAGAILVNQDGTFSYDDGGDVSGHPAPGVSAAAASFTFTLWDGQLESPAQPCGLTFIGYHVNQAPSATPKAANFNVPSP